MGLRLLRLAGVLDLFGVEKRRFGLVKVELKDGSEMLELGLDALRDPASLHRPATLPSF